MFNLHKPLYLDGNKITTKIVGPFSDQLTGKPGYFVILIEENDKTIKERQYVFPTIDEATKKFNNLIDNYLKAGYSYKRGTKTNKFKNIINKIKEIIK